MKLFIYRTFTWTTVGVVACATSFVAGAITNTYLQEEGAKIKKTTETPVS